MNVAKLRQELVELIKKQVPVQTVWATCKEVDEDNKTMTATGELDKLDYFNVLLSLGNITKFPTVGTRCLLGLIQNQPSACYLIDCAEFTRLLIELESGFKLDLSDDEILLNGDSKGALMIHDNVKREIDKLFSNMTTLKNATYALAVVLDATAPGTSATFVTATAAMEAKSTLDFENNNIKHG